MAGLLKPPWNARHSAPFCLAYIHLYHTCMGPAQTHTGYMCCTTTNPSSTLHPHHVPAPPSASFRLHFKWKLKKNQTINVNIRGGKAGGSRLCVCAEIYRKNGLYMFRPQLVCCAFWAPTQNIYHKPLDRAFLTFTSYTGPKLVWVAGLHQLGYLSNAKGRRREGKES